MNATTLMKDNVVLVTGADQMFDARGDDEFLFNQHRPVCVEHTPDRWTLPACVDRVFPGTDRTSCRSISRRTSSAGIRSDDCCRYQT